MAKTFLLSLAIPRVEGEEEEGVLSYTEHQRAYVPQADEPATSSGCRLLDRDTCVLDNEEGGGEGDVDEFLSFVVGERVTRDDDAA